MEESGQQGQDRGSSASIATLPSHVGDDHSADNCIIDKPKNERNNPLNPSADSVNQSSNTYTTPQTYFYGGYDDGLINWGESSNYVHTNNFQIMSPAIYNENSSFVFHPAYTYDAQIAYNQFPQIGTPLSPIIIDGQLYSPHRFPISPSYYSQPFSPNEFTPTTIDAFNETMFMGPGYYLQYPESTQSNPVGILGPYHGYPQTGSHEAKFVDRDSVSLTGESHATTSDRNRGPRALKPKGSGSGDHTLNDHFNRDDFFTVYENAKFFVIKSFSEDNVHRSIKYGVWASTPLGNRKLDAAYKEAKESGGTCRIFLFFSVNASGQFCGVAEMIGPVDFENDADYWQQDRWSGQFRVQWHIIKDVPNSRFRHILLENNDNKPVTHSRDSQEVKLEDGNKMLRIFKEHDSDTSILDDFHFYDEREKSFQEKRANEHISSAKNTIDDEASINRLSDKVAYSLQLEKHKEVTKS
ncbi:hypothetical protein L2E82_38717 [Cichorium intybus]|uniref:Uncharacterized protein n=1 Tax=Cichorium intybus TaxID=13427 RepID=A0ACB9AFM4_CICIN|nr:hypothetical protein L2E82_38717 [Cichorium intybus]